MVIEAQHSVTQKTMASHLTPKGNSKTGKKKSQNKASSKGNFIYSTSLTIYKFQLQKRPQANLYIDTLSIRKKDCVWCR